MTLIFDTCLPTCQAIGLLSAQKGEFNMRTFPKPHNTRRFGMLLAVPAAILVLVVIVFLSGVRGSYGPIPVP